MQTAKPSGQFENSVFEIRAIREIARLTARCPLNQPLSILLSAIQNHLENIKCEADCESVLLSAQKIKHVFFILKNAF